jgi:hypothetical protein
MAPTTMEAPAETGADFDAGLDDLLATASGGDEPAGEPTPVEHAADEAPGGEGPTAPPDGAQPEQTPPGEGPTSEYQLSEDGQHYLVPKDQLGVMQTNREYLQKVQEHFPTVADAQEARQLSANWNQMRQDFLHNGEQGLDKMMAYLTGKNVDPQYPEVRAQFEQAFTRMATKMPAILENMAPEAHRGVVGSLIGPYIEGAYQHAAETGDPAILKAAQNVDWFFTGQYKAEAPKYDPNAAAIQQQQAREQEISAREQRILDGEWNGFTQQNVEGAKAREFNSEISKALAPLKERYDPDTFKYVQDRVVNELLGKMKQDQIWANDHVNQLKMLRAAFNDARKVGRTPNLQAAQAWKNDFMLRVRRNIGAITTAVTKNVPANAKPGTTRTAKTQTAPARTTAPARAQNGQYTREQREAAFDKGIDDLVGTFGFN